MIATRQGEYQPDGHINRSSDNFIENASKKLNMSIDEIEKYEENVTNSLLYTIHMMAQVNSGNLDMLTKEGHVFVEE